MVIIRFHSKEAERRALGYLMGRFNFRSWSDGRTMVPTAALAALATEDIAYFVEGPARYEDYAPAVRNPPAHAV